MAIALTTLFLFAVIGIAIWVLVDAFNDTF